MKSSDRILVGRYAKAYDELSACAQEAARRFEALRDAAEGLAAAGTVMQNPKVSIQQKEELVKTVFAGEPLVSHFIMTLLSAKRYALLPEITREVEALLEKREGVVRAQVASAQPLTDAQKKQVETTLAAREQKHIRAEYTTDEHLIGGLKILCNGILIDGSVAGRLRKLQEELTK